MSSIKNFAKIWYKSGRDADLLLNKYFPEFRFPKRMFYMTKERILTLNYLNVYLKLPALNHPEQTHTTSWIPRMNRTIINIFQTLPTNFKSNWKNHMKN